MRAERRLSHDSGGASRRAAGLGSLLCLLLVPLSQPRAEEGGMGHYVPGTLATLIDLAPTKPGFVIEPIYLHYGGDASATLPVAGEATANLEATIDAVLLGGFYTFDETVLGAHYSFGAFVPYSWVTVEGNVTTGLATGRRKDSESGFGDMTLIPAMLAWKRDSWQFNALLSVYAPTGEYDEDRLANPGLNYWTFDPAVGVSYNNVEIGFNAALHGGVTLNAENPDTDYHSGSLVHVEASVQQLLPLGPGFVGLGAEAFYLQQVSGDSGGNPSLGDFEGRTVGIGPVLTYLLPLGEDILVAEARWLPEIDTEKRLEGDYFWFKLVYQF